MEEGMIMYYMDRKAQIKGKNPEVSKHCLSYLRAHEKCRVVIWDKKILLWNN